MADFSPVIGFLARQERSRRASVSDLSTAGDNPKGMTFPLCNQVQIKAKTNYSSRFLDIFRGEPHWFQRKPNREILSLHIVLRMHLDGIRAEREMASVPIGLLRHVPEQLLLLRCHCFFSEVLAMVSTQMPRIHNSSTAMASDSSRYFRIEVNGWFQRVVGGHVYPSKIGLILRYEPASCIPRLRSYKETVGF